MRSAIATAALLLFACSAHHADDAVVTDDALSTNPTPTGTHFYGLHGNLVVGAIEALEFMNETNVVATYVDALGTDGSASQTHVAHASVLITADQITLTFDEGQALNGKVVDKSFHFDTFDLDAADCDVVCGDVNLTVQCVDDLDGKQPLKMACPEGDE